VWRIGKRAPADPVEKGVKAWIGGFFTSLRRLAESPERVRAEHSQSNLLLSDASIQRQSPEFRLHPYVAAVLNAPYLDAQQRYSASLVRAAFSMAEKSLTSSGVLAPDSIEAEMLVATSALARSNSASRSMA